jgi:hypothetical protein
MLTALHTHSTGSYCGYAKKNYIINGGWIFNMAFNIVKPTLPEAAVRKFSMVSEEVILQELSEVIDVD